MQFISHPPTACEARAASCPLEKEASDRVENQRYKFNTLKGFFRKVDIAELGA